MRAIFNVSENPFDAQTIAASNLKGNRHNVKQALKRSSGTLSEGLRASVTVTPSRITPYQAVGNASNSYWHCLEIPR